MKKLNQKQLKKIKAGWNLTGALIGGIASLVKSAANAINDWVQTSVMSVFAHREFSKGHVKMTVKMGENAISYDDTALIKAQTELAEEKLKVQKLTEKQTKLIHEPKPQLIDLSKHHEVQADHHNDDFLGLTHETMHMLDDFMHF